MISPAEATLAVESAPNHRSPVKLVKAVEPEITVLLLEPKVMAEPVVLGVIANVALPVRTPSNVIVSPANVLELVTAILPWNSIELPLTDMLPPIFNAPKSTVEEAVTVNAPEVVIA